MIFIAYNPYMEKSIFLRIVSEDVGIAELRNPELRFFRYFRRIRFQDITK